MNRILIAEDESRISAFLEKGLQANGFSTSVVSNGSEAAIMALDSNFDLMILDLGLPGKDGMSVLEELRGQGAQLPIIILSAKDEVLSKVHGLESGADDYVTKPFRFEELLARVRVRLRPVATSLNSTSDDLTVQFKEFSLDLRTRRAWINEQQVELSAKEFTLAEVFLRHPDQVMSREQLLNHVWGYDYDPGSNIVDVYVGYLRKKLKTDRIETVRGVGYRLSAQD
jgi:two-component system, OmpR family, response regulator QseB